jgi:hypothetical protein
MGSAKDDQSFNQFYAAVAAAFTDPDDSVLPPLAAAGKRGYELLIQAALGALRTAGGQVDLNLFERRFVSSSLLIEGGQTAGRAALADLYNADVAQRTLSMVIVAFLSMLQGHMTPEPFGKNDYQTLEKYLANPEALSWWGEDGVRFLGLAATNMGSTAWKEYWTKQGFDYRARLDLKDQLIEGFLASVADSFAVSTISAPMEEKMPYDLTQDPINTLPIQTAQSFAEAFDRVGWLGINVPRDNLVVLYQSLQVRAYYPHQETLLADPTIFAVEIAPKHNLRPSQVILNDTRVLGGTRTIDNGVWMSSGQWLILANLAGDKWLWPHEALRGWSLSPDHQLLDLDLGPDHLTITLNLKTPANVVPEFISTLTNFLNAIYQLSHPSVPPSYPTPTRSSSPAQRGGPDLAGQLAQLGALHAQGILTDQEFTAAKQRLLS